MGLFQQVRRRVTPSRNFARANIGLAGLGLALLTGSVGCNWTTFADDARKAPVRSIGAPDSFKEQDFGRSLLPLSDGQGKAAAFMASSTNGTSVSVFTVDSGGGVSSTSIPGSALNDTEASTISSLAEDVGSLPLKLVLASPKVHNQGYGRVYSYTLSPMLDGAVNTLAVPPLPEEPGLGRGLAIGRVGGVETKSDTIVASDANLVVMVDGTTWTAPAVMGSGCDPTFDATLDPRYKLHRPILAARLWPDPAGTTVQQIVSASPHAPGGASGMVSFFSVTGAGTSFELSCLAAVTAPKPEMRARFGVSLATGDFNADGQVDLLVGAPGQNAYIYMGPFAAGTVPTPISISDSEGVDFGFSVAALNVDGNPGDEALIGDPYATVEGKSQAGRVTAYAVNAATMTTEVKKTYSDHNPEANANFGWTVSGLKFCTASPSPAAGMPCPSEVETSRVLMVGAANEVFLYFREGANIPERAAGANTISDVRAP
jgi:hypothetical protein